MSTATAASRKGCGCRITAEAGPWPSSHYRAKVYAIDPPAWSLAGWRCGANACAGRGLTESLAVGEDEIRIET
jgi:hypothetical protein